MTVPASPAPAGRAAPSGYLMAAVALVVVAPLALAGWLAGAAAIRSGRVSRGRLAAAAAVTGTLALLVIGPSVAAGGLLSAVTALGGVLPATLTAGAVLEALSAILGRGVGLAAVTVPAGILAATIPPRQDLAVRPEWAERERRARIRAEARTRRRVGRAADREGTNPRSAALAVSLGGDLDRWRLGSGAGAVVVPPPGHLDLATLLVGQPGVGKTVAISRLAYLAACERRHLVVVDAKGGHDGLAGDVVAAVLQAWPQARIGLFPRPGRPLARLAGRPGESARPGVGLLPRGRLLPRDRRGRPAPGPGPARAAVPVLGRARGPPRPGRPGPGLGRRHRDAEPDPLAQGRAPRRACPRQ